MMTPTKTDLSKKTALVVDNGLFVLWAQKLAETFGKVLYFSPWVDAFPKSNYLIVGDGLPEIERVKSIWEYTDAADLVVFPDVYYADVQEQLVQMGKRVWGGRYGDELELNRAKTKKLLKKIGLPVGGYEEITGTEDLKKYLKEHNDVWVKISSMRGDFETFQSETYDLSEPKVAELEHKLGAKSKIAQFVVEDNLPDRVEIGYDGFTIDGEFPPTAMVCIEIKDLGAVGRVKKYEDMDDPVIEVNDKLSPIFKNYQYRGFFSSEIRYGADKKPFLIDPCCRAASPPSELYCEMFENWGEIMWHGAGGEVIDPVPVAEYGVEVMIHSPWADHNWQSIKFPEKLRPFVKLRNHARIDGVDFVVPQDVGLPEIGAVIGMGDSLEDAIEMVKENAEQVKGYFLECKIESIDKGLEEIEHMKEFGLSF